MHNRKYAVRRSNIWIAIRHIYRHFCTKVYQVNVVICLHLCVARQTNNFIAKHVSPGGVLLFSNFIKLINFSVWLRCTCVLFCRKPCVIVSSATCIFHHKCSRGVYKPFFKSFDITRRLLYILYSQMCVLQLNFAGICTHLNQKQNALKWILSACSLDFECFPIETKLVWESRNYIKTE